MANEDRNQGGAQPRATLSDVFARLNTGAVTEQTPVPKSEISEVWNQVKQNLELKNLQMAYRIADSGDGGGGAAIPVPDAIDQVTRLNQAIGPNYNAMLKDQREALIASESARTQAEKREADLRYAMLSKGIDEANARSEAIVREFKEISQAKPKPQYLFGAADEATDGQFTKQHLAKLFGQPAAPIDPMLHAKAVIDQAEEYKKMFGWNQPAPAERVPLAENIDYVRAVLEDKRWTAIEQQKIEIEKKKADTVSNFINMLPGAISDAVAAWGAKHGGGIEQPAQVRSKAPANAAPPAAPKPQYIKITCPNPACGQPIPWPKEAQAGAVGECPYCHMAIRNDGDEGEEEKA
jgi:hypothetical protein